MELNRPAPITPVGLPVPWASETGTAGSAVPEGAPLPPGAAPSAVHAGEMAAALPDAAPPATDHRGLQALVEALGSRLVASRSDSSVPRPVLGRPVPPGVVALPLPALLEHAARAPATGFAVRGASDEHAHVVVVRLDAFRPPAGDVASGGSAGSAGAASPDGSAGPPTTARAAVDLERELIGGLERAYGGDRARVPLRVTVAAVDERWLAVRLHPSDDHGVLVSSVLDDAGFVLLARPGVVADPAIVTGGRGKAQVPAPPTAAAIVAALARAHPSRATSLPAGLGIGSVLGLVVAAGTHGGGRLVALVVAVAAGAIAALVSRP